MLIAIIYQSNFLLIQFLLIKDGKGHKSNTIKQGAKTSIIYVFKYIFNLCLKKKRVKRRVYIPEQQSLAKLYSEYTFPSYICWYNQNATLCHVYCGGAPRRLLHSADFGGPSIALHVTAKGIYIPGFCTQLETYHFHS